jgi:hypothetical protein
MNKYALGTILGSALLSMYKAKKGSSSQAEEFLMIYEHRVSIDIYFQINADLEVSLDEDREYVDEQSSAKLNETINKIEDILNGLDIKKILKENHIDHPPPKCIDWEYYIYCYMGDSTNEDAWEPAGNHAGRHYDSLDYIDDENKTLDQNQTLDCLYGQLNFGFDLKRSANHPVPTITTDDIEELWQQIEDSVERECMRIGVDIDFIGDMDPYESTDVSIYVIKDGERKRYEGDYSWGINSKSKFAKSLPILRKR